MFDNFFLQNVLFLFFMGTVVRNENYSPYQIYILCMSSERDIFILAEVILKVMSTLKCFEMHLFQFCVKFFSTEFPYYSSIIKVTTDKRKNTFLFYVKHVICNLQFDRDN